MKKILILFIGVLILPSLTFAAFNDVTLTTDTVISVGGYALNVSGSSAAVESIVIDTSSFSVTLASGSSIQITSPTFQQLSVDVDTFTTSNTCITNSSVLTLSSSGASGSVVVTPTATICSTPVSSGGGGGGSRSGGDDSKYADESQRLLDLQVQINFLTATLRTLIIQRDAQGLPVPDAARILANMSIATGTTSYIFPRNLTLGSTGEDVRALQILLNSQGFTVSTSGAGSPGNESTYFGTLTRSALAAYQRSKGITPAVGYLGPITRASLR